MPTDPPAVELRRPFGWGVLFIADHDGGADADLVDVDPDQPVTWSPRGAGAAVVVRHAQDVDPDDRRASGSRLDDDEGADVPPPSEVQVAVHHHRAPQPVDPALEGLVHIPSGVLGVGDADEELAVALEPGWWRVQLTLSPPPETQRVDVVQVWLSPTSADERPAPAHSALRTTRRQPRWWRRR